ncbi:hypothetical protein WOLCODRAFT_159917 [Wolfiporia cocos MD-104 SS10]|uniref:Uncharacterized protein n=1 Tax=Wolfiporia cocos (strain MD-104) TaxID=742152 RepID=A0A2H3J985_WOLCO|nr:hypothetical protein WOLCODRAFT_159917 [Wolfiporia cocos MD-104 SS10]
MESHFSHLPDEHAKALARKLAYYCITSAKSGKVIRLQPVRDQEAAYNAALEAWNADSRNPRWVPSKDDEERTHARFDETRETEPTTLHDRFCYRDARTDQVGECTMVDYGKSRPRGLYFDIRDANEVEARITPEEMKQVLEDCYTRLERHGMNLEIFVVLRYFTSLYTPGQSDGTGLFVADKAARESAAAACRSPPVWPKGGGKSSVYAMAPSDEDEDIFLDKTEYPGTTPQQSNSNARSAFHVQRETQTCPRFEILQQTDALPSDADVVVYD